MSTPNTNKTAAGLPLGKPEALSESYYSNTKPYAGTQASGVANSKWAVGYQDTGSAADTFNKAQAYLTGGTYTPGATYDAGYWSSAGGGGKNMLMGNGKDYTGNYMTNEQLQKASIYANMYDNQMNLIAELQRAAEAKEQEKKEREAFEQEMKNMWAGIQSAQQAQYNAAQEAQRKATQATVDSIRSNEVGINDAYEKAAQEAYISRVLQGTQANDYLSAMGYSGGMAESTLAQIANNYENNRNNAVSQRDEALRQNERLIAEAQASGDQNLAQIASNYYDNYVNTLQNQAQMNYQLAAEQRAMDYQRELDAQNQANIDRDYALQAAQWEYNRQNAERDYLATLEQKRREQEVAQINQKQLQSINKLKAQGYKVNYYTDPVTGVIQYYYTAS